MCISVLTRSNKTLIVVGTIKWKEQVVKIKVLTNSRPYKVDVIVLKDYALDSDDFTTAEELHVIYLDELDTPIGEA